LHWHCGQANLGFVKALVAKSKADMLHEHLNGVVEGLLSWQSDTKNSFKAKVSVAFFYITIFLCGQITIIKSLALY
jgi:ribosomal RNA-processing protein 12